jgi:hypothetical protein
MNRILFVSIFLVSILSCSKEGIDEGPNQSNTKLLKKITSIYNNEKPEISEYFYDANRKIIKDQSGDNITTYEYLPNLIKTTRINQVSKEIQTINEINLDEKGRAKQINSKNKEGKIIAYTEYIYDANGYALKVVNGYPNQTPSHREFVIQDGNYIGGKRFTGDTHTRNFEYKYENKESKIPWSVFSLFPSETYFGKPYKNYINEYKELDLTGKVVYHTKSILEYDKDGYPLKVTLTNILTGDKSIDTYIYE